MFLYDVRYLFCVGEYNSMKKRNRVKSRRYRYKREGGCACDSDEDFYDALESKSVNLDTSGAYRAYKKQKMNKGKKPKTKKCKRRK